MSAPFRLEGGEVAVRLTRFERELLARLPAILASVGTGDDDAAAVRLTPVTYPSDPEAEEHLRSVTTAELEAQRRADREALAASADRDRVSREQAEGWLRVIGEARLALAARAGITEDGWEARRLPEPMGSALHLLGALQDELVGVLSDGLS